MPEGIGYPSFFGGGARLPIDYLRMIQGDAAPAFGVPGSGGPLAEILNAAPRDAGLGRAVPGGNPAGPGVRPTVPRLPLPPPPGGTRRAVPDQGVQTPPDGTRRAAAPSGDPYLTNRFVAGGGWANPGQSIALPGGGSITMPAEGLTQAEYDVLSGVRAGTPVAAGNERILGDLARRGVFTGHYIGSDGVNRLGFGPDGQMGSTLVAALPPGARGFDPSSFGGGSNADFFSALRGNPTAPTNDTMTRDRVVPGGGRAAATQRFPSSPRAPGMPAPPQAASPTPASRPAPKAPRPVYRTPPPPPPDAGATKMAGSPPPFRNELNRQRAMLGRGFNRQSMPNRRAGRTDRLMGNR